MLRQPKIVPLLNILLLLLIVPGLSAREDETDTYPTNSMTDIIERQDQFSTLQAAMELANLKETLAGGSWTLFAPTNQAFAAAGLDPDSLKMQYTAETMRDFLLYHAMNGQFSTAELQSMLGDVTMANSQLAGLKSFEGAIYANDDAKVISPNILAANGYIHAVDKLILGPWPKETSAQETAAERRAARQERNEMQRQEEMAARGIPPNSIAGMTYGTIFGAAMDAAGLTEQFTGGNWTVFMPRDRAFTSMGLNANNLLDLYSPEQLADIVLYHVMPGDYTSGTLPTIQGDVTMANGKKAGLKMRGRQIWMNDISRVVTRDIDPDNGAIHIMNLVIQPPWPRDTSAMEAREEAMAAAQQEQLAMFTSELSALGITPDSIAGKAYTDVRTDTFSAAINAAGLTDQLSSGSWTAFIPTDDAFARLGLTPDNIAEEYSPEQLAGLILYHILPGNYTKGALEAMLGDVTMANGQLAGLKSFDGDLYVNDDSKVVQTDISATNGTIHIVDNVIMLPWPR